MSLIRFLINAKIVKIITYIHKNCLLYAIRDILLQPEQINLKLIQKHNYYKFLTSSQLNVYHEPHFSMTFYYYLILIYNIFCFQLFFYSLLQKHLLLVQNYIKLHKYSTEFNSFLGSPKITLTYSSSLIARANYGN